jgi:hypothetical protein
MAHADMSGLPNRAAAVEAFLAIYGQFGEYVFTGRVEEDMFAVEDRYDALRSAFIHGYEAGWDHAKRVQSQEAS